MDDNKTFKNQRINNNSNKHSSRLVLQHTVKWKSIKNHEPDINFEIFS